MKLPEFHVLKRNAGTRRHAKAVTGVDEGVGAGRINAPCTAGGEQCRLGLQNHYFAGFHFHRYHAEHVARLIANQIERHPLNEKLRMRAHIALIQRMQHGVTGTVRGSARALDRALAIVARLTTKWALIYTAIRGAIERHTEMLEFVDGFIRLATHKFNRVLIAEIIRTLDGVEHMPVPVVLAVVAKRRRHTTLRRDCMRAGGKHFGQHGDLEIGLGQLECRTQA